MYLSIIKKNKGHVNFNERMKYAKALAESRKKYKDLNNEQNVHRMICDMTGGCKRENQNLLYIKISDDMFYIQSDCMLDKQAVRKCGYNIVKVKDEGALLKSMKNGDRVVLRTKLAPVERNCSTRIQHSLANDDKKRAAWLERVSERCGFRFTKTPIESAMDHIRWKKNGQGNSWTNAFYYTGEIEITDKEKFVCAVEKGVGKYKAYGCGMMMVG